MVFKTLRLFVLSLVLLTLASCGGETADDDGDPNNATSNDTSGNNTISNGTSGNNTTSNNTSGNNTTSNNATINNTTPDDTTGCTEITPPIGTCDPLCQTGCEMSEHCVTQDNQGVLESMCEVSGASGQDQECSDDADCGFGFTCKSHEGGPLLCRQYCRPNNPEEPNCSEDYICKPFVVELRIGYCLQVEHMCDLFPDTCDDGDNCYDTDEGRQCLPVGDRDVDAACSTSDECSDGLRCVGVAGMGEVCKPICDPDAGGGQCEGPTTCHTLEDGQGNTLPWGACY